MARVVQNGAPVLSDCDLRFRDALLMRQHASLSVPEAALETEVSPGAGSCSSHNLLKHSHS